MGGLGSTAKETNVPPHRHRPFTYMPLDDFTVDTVKRSLAALSVFSPLPTHLARPDRTFYICPSKKGNGEGRWLLLRSSRRAGEDPCPQRIVCEGLVLYIYTALKKLPSHRLGPSKENIKETPFYLDPFFDKYFPDSVGTHLVHRSPFFMYIRGAGGRCKFWVWVYREISYLVWQSLPLDSPFISAAIHSSEFS